MKRPTFMGLFFAGCMLVLSGQQAEADRKELVCGHAILDYEGSLTATKVVTRYSCRFTVSPGPDLTSADIGAQTAGYLKKAAAVASTEKQMELITSTATPALLNLFKDVLIVDGIANAGGSGLVKWLFESRERVSSCVSGALREGSYQEQDGTFQLDCSFDVEVKQLKIAAVHADEGLRMVAVFSLA